MKNNPVKPTLKTEIIPLVLLIITVVLSFYFYANWPDQVASHWNFKGEVDGWSSKTFNAIFFPLLLVGMYLLFIFLPYLDPKKDRYQEFSKPYHIFKASIIGILAIIYLAMGAYNLGYAINIGQIVPLFIGLMMIVIGNFMGKVKNNWFMGIRTPWTLSSENVWNKTHRLGGWLFMIFGLIIIIAPYLPEPLSMGLFFLGALALILGTTVYSYLIYRQEQKNIKK